ncbi:MAG: hypothetical protein IPP26_14855 [Flavobacteriales bacterium]|nr:hypothetical protein [Flavobacteriales bacterium]
MSPAELQQTLFKQVKERLPAHVSLAEELASVLGVSADSAYRRIRGEKPLDLGELALIARKYRVSVDGLLGQQAGGFLFSGNFVDDKDFSFPIWLASLNEQLAFAAEGKDTTFIFQSKDVPLFHHFQVPELALFKFFFWRKTILQQEGPDLAHFDLAQRDEALFALGRKVFLTYCRMPSTEIWNAESMNSTLRQINYYRETGLFRKEDDAQQLFDRCLELLDHLELQAERGVKFPMGSPPEQGAATYQLYHNEVLLGDNAIYADNGRLRVVFLNHTGVNYLGTTDERFVEHTQRALGNIMKRSSLISGSGEKERRRFFKGLREEVELRRK